MTSPHHTVTGWAGSGRPAHADRPWRPAGRLVPAAVGLLIVLGALGLGTAACLNSLGPVKSTPTSASQITRDTAAKTP